MSKRTKAAELEQAAGRAETIEWTDPRVEAGQRLEWARQRRKAAEDQCRHGIEAHRKALAEAEAVFERARTDKSQTDLRCQTAIRWAPEADRAELDAAQRAVPDARAAVHRAGEELREAMAAEKAAREDVAELQRHALPAYRDGRTESEKAALGPPVPERDYTLAHRGDEVAFDALELLKARVAELPKATADLDAARLALADAEQACATVERRCVRLGLEAQQRDCAAAAEIRSKARG